MCRVYRKMMTRKRLAAAAVTATSSQPTKRAATMNADVKPPAAPARPKEEPERKEGCVRLNNQVWLPLVGYGTYRLSEAQCGSCTKRAVDLGYQLVDTAHVYNNGKTETALGKACDAFPVFLNAFLSPGLPSSQSRRCTHGYAICRCWAKTRTSS